MELDHTEARWETCCCMDSPGFTHLQTEHCSASDFYTTANTILFMFPLCFSEAHSLSVSFCVSKASQTAVIGRPPSALFVATVHDGVTVSAVLLLNSRRRRGPYCSACAFAVSLEHQSADCGAGTRVHRSEGIYPTLCGPRSDSAHRRKVQNTIKQSHLRALI